MAPIEPYKIHVPQEKIDRLHKKLALSDLPDEIDGAEWTYGAPLADIRKLTQYWKDDFRWRDAEAKLNELPHFTTDIEVAHFGTLNVHFIHRVSPNPNAIPLLFVHGWPGSFIEVTKILAQLVDGAGAGDNAAAAPAFHVVAPSLIDYGFSQGCPRKGFSIDQQTEMCHKLMGALGYGQYVAQGGDIGAFVVRLLGSKHPRACRAHHTNMAVPREPTEAEFPALYARVQGTALSAAEQAGLARSKWFNEDGNAYMQEHSTRPQTIGYSMVDSPVGLLAWIYEKLHDWTDGYAWTPDEVLTWVSIYYFSRAGPHAPQRIYYAFRHGDPINGERSALERITDYTPDVKIGVMRMPKEILLMPKLWVHTMGEVVFESEYEKGGHFAAWERPDAMVKDLREMFGKGGGAEGIVEGKSGYA